LLIAIVGSEAFVILVSVLFLIRHFTRHHELLSAEARVLLGTLGVVWLAALGVSIMYVRSITHRLAGMTEQVQHQVTSGDLGAMLPITREDEIGRLASAFNQLITANRQAVARLSERADEMAMLSMLAAVISETLDLQRVLDVSLRLALAAMGWEAGSIYLWDGRADSFNMVTYVNLPEDYVREAWSYRLGEGIIGRAAREGQIILANGHENDIPATSELSSLIGIPLRIPGRLMGVMSLGSKTLRRPDSNQLELLKTVSYQVAVALEKAQLHSDLAKHAEELEDMVKARTEELAQVVDELSVALERAQEADKLKSQLLSTVSHELRTPLATIKGHTSMLVEHHANVTPETLLEFLTDVEEESDKLTGLISDLLEMSRIEAGVLHIQPQMHNLLDVVRSTVESAQVREPNHPISLKSSNGRLPIYADARRVQQILDNLLNNAVKYSEPGNPITVEVTEHDDGPVISVKDKGYGIAADQLDRVFDRFYRVDSDSSRTHGIGLGLAICRGLVEAHGGHIWVESEGVPGRGSTFSFSLPARENENGN
jgi:signal transduction histidine kinase